MRFLETLTVVIIASLAMSACADEGRTMAQDLADLRQQLDSPHQAGTDAFHQAVLDVAQGEQARDARFLGNTAPANGAIDNWSAESWGPPPRNSTSNWTDNRRQNIPPNWLGTRRPRIRSQPVPTPASRLRETAFHLDRLAHELEMAELYEGADTLRDTAEKLRQSARQITLPGQEGPALGPPPTPSSLAPSSPAVKKLPQ